MANPEYFTPGTDSLFVVQTATIPAGGSVALGPEWYFKGDTDRARAAQTSQARALFGIASVTGVALSDLSVVFDVEGARSTPDQGVRADLLLYTPPPQIATIDLIRARVPSYGKPWAPVIINGGGASAAVTVVWRFDRAMAG